MRVINYKWKYSGVIKEYGPILSESPKEIKLYCGGKGRNKICNYKKKTFGCNERRRK